MPLQTGQDSPENEVVFQTGVFSRAGAADVQRKKGGPSMAMDQNEEKTIGEIDGEETFGFADDLVEEEPGSAFMDGGEEKEPGSAEEDEATEEAFGFADDLVEEEPGSVFMDEGEVNEAESAETDETLEEEAFGFAEDLVEDEVGSVFMDEGENPESTAAGFEDDGEEVRITEEGRRILSKSAEKIMALLSACRKQAEALLQKESGTEDLLLKAEEKISRIPMAGSLLKYIPEMILMIRSYIRREYR
ncbi:MAG: hypothetical protein IKD86_03875 [Firmicutes bacterium]|nr:hypothetical protein [Bacillota bacterium]